MTYKLPETGFDPGAQIISSMLSIVREDAATGAVLHYPWRIYLRECDRQAETALRHLDRAWSLLADVRSPESESPVWAEMQGALTAGIILSRLLKPGRVRARDGLDDKQAKAKSDARGEHLRGLLAIGTDSPLLRISKIRDPIEHFDERIDAAVEADALSLSDWYLAREGYMGTPTAYGTPKGGHTVGLRVFAPLPGLLIFDRQVFDLFEWEDALFGLRNAMPEAIDRAEDGLGSYRLHRYGAAQIYVWKPEDLADRRAEWARLRERRNVPMPIDWPPPLPTPPSASTYDN